MGVWAGASLLAVEGAEENASCAGAVKVVSVDGAEASEPRGVDDCVGAEASGTEPAHRPGRSGSGEAPGPTGRCIGTAVLRLLGSQTCIVVVLWRPVP